MDDSDTTWNCQEITELKKEIAEYEAVEQYIMKTIRNGGEYDDILKAHYREGKVVDGEWVDDKEEEEDDSDDSDYNDMCDCCANSWRNDLPGKDTCNCSCFCGNLLRDCRYTCDQYKMTINKNK